MSEHVLAEYYFTARLADPSAVSTEVTAELMESPNIFGEKLPLYRVLVQVHQDSAKAVRAAPHIKAEEVAVSKVPECGEFVAWWDGEYEGNCELPEGHEGHHFDGLSCFTGDHSDAEQVYDCTDPAHT